MTGHSAGNIPLFFNTGRPVSKLRHILIVLAALAIGGGATYGYRYLLDKELAGYRGRKEADLKLIIKRDAARPAIPGHAADRERVLAKRFGKLPEGFEVRSELELVKKWQWVLVAMFAPFGLGVPLYVALARKPSLRQRLLRGFLLWAGLSQALPLLLLPESALQFYREAGTPIVAVCLLALTVLAVLDRRAANRAGQTI